MARVCPKLCTDLKERSKLQTGIQGHTHPPPAPLLIILSFQVSSLISLHSTLPLPWAGTSAPRHGWLWQSSPLHRHTHTLPRTHARSKGINGALMLHPDSFGSKPAKRLTLGGGRHDRQGLRIPGGQPGESCFQPSLAHICLFRG